MHVTLNDVNLCDGLECVYVMDKSRASTARELPDKYMGFCQLKYVCYLRATWIFMQHHPRCPADVNAYKTCLIPIIKSKRCNDQRKMSSFFNE